MKKFFSTLWELWKKFGRLLGLINTEIILFIFYFLIFAPMGLIMRLFGHDLLNLKAKKQSSWKDVKIGQFDNEKAKRQS